MSADRLGRQSETIQTIAAVAGAAGAAGIYDTGTADVAVPGSMPDGRHLCRWAVELGIHPSIRCPNQRRC